MSRPAPPTLTVRYDGAARTFAAGNDVVIGRDLRADVRIAHPLISRAHLVLRFDQGRWLAIDNGSLNGMFVQGRRVPTVDIQDGQRLNIGNPDGPELTFDVGRHAGSAGRPPTTSIPVAGPSGSGPSQQPRTQPPPTPAAVPVRCAAGLPVDPAAAVPERPAAELYRAAGATHPGAQRGGATGFPAGPFATRARVGDVDRSDGRTAFQRGEPRDEHAEDPAARPSRRRAARLDQDRPQHRQRHRHPRRPGVAPPRDAGADRRGHRDPRQPQHQRDIRQRFAHRDGGPARGRHRHDRQRRPGVPWGHARPAHRNHSGERHRRPRRARRHMDHRGQQDAAGQHLADGAARHADRRHRPIGRRQVDLRPIGGRLHPPDHRHGGLRGSRHPRRVRLAALPDRDGAPGRRGARPADREPGADVRGRAAAAAGHQQGRPRTGRRAGARGTRDDPARAKPASTSCPAVSASAHPWRWSC